MNGHDNETTRLHRAKRDLSERIRSLESAAPSEANQLNLAQYRGEYASVVARIASAKAGAA